MGGSPGELSEELVTLDKPKKGWRMNFDVGEATEGLENELWRRWNDGRVGEWAELIVIVIAELILQPFHHFTYVTTNSPTLPSLYLRHSSFSNPSVASPTSKFILQPFFRFSYITKSSLNSPGEPPMFVICFPRFVFHKIVVNKHSLFKTIFLNGHITVP